MEVNKAVAAVLVAGIAFFVAGTIGTTLVREHRLEKPAIKIDVPEAASPGGQTAPEPLPPIANLLANADIAAGQAYAGKVCGSCHSFTEGGKAGIGPNLYGVVGAPHGHSEGFNYSTALKSKPGSWTYDELNEWLHKPGAFAPGTRMAFAGISNDQDRANVIDYLHTLAQKPEPLPAPVAASPSGPAAANKAAPPAASGEPPIATLMASADVQAGDADTKKLGCIACHTFNEGGKSGLGPNLYGVVGAPHGHAEGFNYSPALKGKPGSWTIEDLDEWLKKPSAFAPGTRMTFVGIKDAKDRADVIAYLRSLSSKPEPAPAK
jgi:cytochrome c